MRAISPMTVAKSLTCYLFRFLRGPLDEQGALVIGKHKLEDLEAKPGSEVDACLKKAFFVGRWFADAGSTASVVAAWDVKID